MEANANAAQQCEEYQNNPDYGPPTVKDIMKTERAEEEAENSGQ